MDYQALAATQGGLLSAVGAYRRTELNVRSNDASSLVAGAFITASFFDVLGVWPRCVSRETLTTAVTRDSRIAVVREGYARQHGRELRCGSAGSIGINGQVYEIIGFIPDALRLRDLNAEFFVAFEPEETWSITGSVVSVRDRPVSVIGRLAPGVSTAQVSLHFSQTMGLGGERAVRLVSLKAEQTRHVADSLLLLQVLAAFVLVVTIVNVTQILVAQANQRVVEITIRAGLGASVWRSHQGLLIESCLVSAGGAAASLLAHHLTSGLLTRFGPGSTVPSLVTGGPGQVLIVGATATLMCAFVPVLVILLRARMTATGLPGPVSSSTSRAGVTRLDLKMAQWLLIGQAAIMTTGLVVGVILLHSTANLLAVDLGFRAERVNAAAIRLQSDDVEGRVRALMRLLDDATSRGTSGYAVASVIPLTSSIVIQVGIAGQTGRTLTVNRVDVSTGYFDVLSIALHEGRRFRSDDSAATEPVLIVSKGFADQFLDGRALGRLVLTGRESWRIVGVAADVYARGARAPSTPTVYVHLPQATRGMFGGLASMLTRAELLKVSNADGATQDAEVRELGRQASSQLSLGPLRPVTTLVDTDTRPTRFLTGVVVVFAALVLVLGALGTAAATNQYLSLRRVDLAVRMALGAPPDAARRLIAAAALLPVFVGAGIGLPMAYITSGLVRAHLFGIEPSSPLPYVVSVLVVMLGCASAVVAPVYRAGRVSPAEALQAP